MWNVISEYFGTTFFLIVLIFFILFLIKRRENNISKRILVACGFFFITFPMLYMVCKWAGMVSGSYRLLWLLPLSMIVAILATEVMENSSKKRGILLLIVIWGVLILGNIGLQTNAWKAIDNPYLLNEEIVRIADMLESDSDKDNIIVVGETDFMMQVCQYSSRVCWGYSRRNYMMNADQYCISNESCRIAGAIQNLYYPEDMDIINDLKKMQIDYVIVYEDNPFTRYLSQGCYEVIGETENYKVIKMNY